MTAKFAAALFVLAFLGFFTVGRAQEETSQQEILEAHNAYRAKHCTPPLTWDADLAAGAQQWADRCVFEHSSFEDPNLPAGRYGENLAGGSVGENAASAVDDWYSEIKDYDFSAPDPRPQDEYLRTGHFTQVVWKDTTQLGCGIATCPGTIFGWAPEDGNVSVYVCRYSPPGNYLEHKQNVLPVCN